MFGRSSAKQIDDQPGWREKLADWRDAPPVVFERPEWMTESPGALLLLFAGTLLALASVVYVVVPADALPASLPGRWNAPPTSSTVSTTTTTTLAPAVKNAILKKIVEKRDTSIVRLATLPSEKQTRAFAWLRALSANNRQDAILEQVANSPPVPPSRYWTGAFLAAVLAVGAFVAAWVVSDTRGRRHFAR